MSKVRVAGFGVSLDGFSAGIEQSLSDPLGKRGTEIFQWFFHTRTFCSMLGKEGGSVGDIDDEFAHRAMDNFGAFVLGRNMFGPVRGPWPDDSWKGWWGDNPPYHAPTFVLTHHEREPLVMEGGTTFYFVTAQSTKRWHAQRSRRQQRRQDWRQSPNGAAVSAAHPLLFLCWLGETR
jgi:dihydrofolate reductase